MAKTNLAIFGLFLTIVLSACGGSSDSKKNVELQNQPPNALINLEQVSIDLNNSVTISGTSSHDPDGDVLSYKWSIKTAGGDDYTLADSTAETFTFTPDDFGVYDVSLIVSDAKSSSKVVTSTLTVNPNAQSYPVAIISDGLNTKIGKINWFSAQRSIAADGQLLTYSWEIKSKPTTSSSAIVDDSKIKAYLIADAVGSYEISLTVTNMDNKLTASKVLNIEVDDVLVNSAPVAIISQPFTTYGTNQLVKFNASASYDSDGDDLDYQWTLTTPTEVQNVSLIGENTEFVEFNVDGLGEYQIGLTVSDHLLNNETSQTFTVTNQNLAPIANAGADQIVAMGTPLILDGAGSSDVDGNASDLTYQWSLVSRPLTSSYDELSSPKYTSESQFSFAADVIGEYVIALQVFDGVDYSTVDHIYIEVTDNQRPVAILGNDIIVNASTNLAINSTESYDPENAALTYLWQLIKTPEGSTAELLSVTNLSMATLSVDIAGTYTIQLTVNDGIQDSLPETLNIVYTPEELFELTVSGQLVDEAGLPLAISAVGGILQKKSVSDENGQFEVLLKSRNKDAALKVLTFSDETILSTILRIPETDEIQVDLGKVKLPLLQRKDISLAACEGYSGTEKVKVYFYLATDGYENMKFIKPVVAELAIGQAAQAIKLPAKGLINMRLATSISSKIYVDSGEAFFTHQYQTDDTQSDPLLLTICN